MISVVELTKRFQTGRKTIMAVDQLSFHVSKGEVYGLLGYAEVEGFRCTVDPEAVKARIGFVSASAGVYPWLTPRETLLFFADLYGVAPGRAEQEMQRLSRVLGLNEYLDQRCATLSTGQKQRVNLARALIHDPPIMLLDEPTRGLDVVGSKIIFDYVAHLRELGKAVIVCTHRLDEAQRLCDRFGLLHHGALLHEGSLDELRSQTGCESLTEMFLRYVPAELIDEVPAS
jgi:sodium transport system ATP-binding protein